jgi:hypothetical protein
MQKIEIQPYLDYKLVVESNPQIVAPTVNRNFDWSRLDPLEEKFHNARKLYYNRKNKRAHKGRPRASSVGRKGFDFHGLVRLYLLAPLFRIGTSPTELHQALQANPAFHEQVAFRTQTSGRGRHKVTRVNPIPSYWVINDFDNIMTEFGLWEQLRQLTCQMGIDLEAIPKKIKLGIDPTAIKAYCNPKNKTKKCKCKDKRRCRHYRKPTDDNARYYNKGDILLRSAHRPVILGEIHPEVGIPLSSHMLKGNKQMDHQTFEDILTEFKNDPVLGKLEVEAVYADGEFSTETNKQSARKILNAPLYTPINPRNRKNTKLKTKGIKCIDKYGVPICKQDYRFSYLGRDHLRHSYIWQAPVSEKGESVCRICPSPCTNAASGRIYRVAAEQTPWIDWNFPQHSYQFKLQLALRTEIERIISRLKYSCGMNGLTKQGGKKASSFVTRAIILSQIVAIVAKILQHPEAMRRIRTLPMAA